MEDKVIFESEEECVKFLKDCFGNDDFWANKYCQQIKANGYIRKSAVEEAEESYIIYKEGKHPVGLEWVIETLYKGFQELKNELQKKS